MNFKEIIGMKMMATIFSLKKHLYCSVQNAATAPCCMVLDGQSGLRNGSQGLRDDNYSDDN